MIGAMAGAAMLLTGSAEAPIGAQVQVALQKRLPKTKVDAIDCSKVDGLCEVVAGANLFYVDKSARYLVIGRVYDMETRQDLTAAKLLALNPDMLVGGAAKANATPDAPEAGAARAGARVTTQPAVARTLDVTRLSSKGAIVWGSGTQTVTVFSDVHCGYCRALSQALDLGAGKPRDRQPGAVRPRSSCGGPRGLCAEPGPGRPEVRHQRSR
jgi:thiol:disulfide interchange protein DsbC